MLERLNEPLSFIIRGVKRMEAKNAKQRLDDLQELLQAGYLTESEFRVARINALKENGVDIVIHNSGSGRRHRGERTETRGSGCGCFSIVLLLIVIGIGVVFFIPDWSSRLEEFYETVREWTLDQWSSFFSDLDPVSEPVPDPVFSEPTVPDPVASDSAAPDPTAPEPVAPDSVDSTPQGNVSPTGVNDGNAPPDPLSSVVQAESRSEPVVYFPSPEPSVSLTDSSHFVHPSLPSLDTQIFALPDLTSNDEASKNVTENATEEESLTVIEGSPNASPVASAAEDIQKSAEGNAEARRGVVSVRSARIRSTPDTTTNNNVVGWGNRGNRFFVLEERIVKDGSTWYHVRSEESGKQGWISSALVTLEKE